MNAPSRLRALAPLLALLTGCAAADDADFDAGGVRELVPAVATSAELPEAAAPGEPVRVGVRGRTPDGCSRLDRFTTRRTGDTLVLEPLATRPVGVCPVADGLAFEATVTLAGLPVGLHRVQVGALPPALLVVAAAPRGEPADCAWRDPATVTRAVLPPATHPEGSATLELEGTLPSWCHVLLPPEVVAGAGRVAVTLLGAACAPLTDAGQCPPEARPFSTRVELGPLAEGTWRVEVGGEEVGTIEVVPRSRCALSRVEVKSVDAPPLGTADAPLPVSWAGVLPSACAAADPPEVSVAPGEVTVEVPLRVCASGCRPDPAPIRRRLEVGGLDPGDWRVRVNDVAAAVPVQVLPAGSCRLEALPETAAGPIVASGSLRAGAPLDLVLYGEGAECAGRVWLEARVEAGVVALTSRVLTCAPCTATSVDLVAVASLPWGLPAGTWRLELDGRAAGTLTVR